MVVTGLGRFSLYILIPYSLLSTQQEISRHDEVHVHPPTDLRHLWCRLCSTSTQVSLISPNAQRPVTKVQHRSFRLIPVVSIPQLVFKLSIKGSQSCLSRKRTWPQPCQAGSTPSLLLKREQRAPATPTSLLVSFAHPSIRVMYTLRLTMSAVEGWVRIKRRRHLDY